MAFVHLWIAIITPFHVHETESVDETSPSLPEEKSATDLLVDEIAQCLPGAIITVFWPRNMHTFSKNCHMYDLVLLTASKIDRFDERTITMYKASVQRHFVCSAEQPYHSDSEQKHIRHHPGPFSELAQYYPHIFTAPMARATTISKQLHFMWLSPLKLNNSELEYNNISKIPLKYRANIKRFAAINPAYQITYWDDADVNLLIKRDFSQYWDLYRSLKRVIHRCDFARWCVLAKYGGVYFDCDFYNSYPLDTLLGDKDILLFAEIPEHQPIEGNKFLCNGLVGATVNHPFVLGYINTMYHNLVALQNSGLIDATEPWRAFDNVMTVTGPIALMEYYKRNKSGIKLSNGALVFPYDHDNITTKQLQQDDIVYTYTLWNEGSDWGGGPNGGEITTSVYGLNPDTIIPADNTRSLLILLLIIIIVIAVVYIVIKKKYR